MLDPLETDYPFKKSFVISKVRAEVNRTLAQLAAWSINIATSGVAPTAGFNGEPFAKDSDRAKRAGATLANGWKSPILY